MYYENTLRTPHYNEIFKVLKTLGLDHEVVEFTPHTGALLLQA